MISMIKWIAIGSAMLVLSSAATADVAWRVNGIFDDGTALTGTFTINPYGFLDTAALTTAAQAPFAGFTYTPGDSSTGTTPTAIDFQPGYTSDLHLVFAANLSHPGTNAIVSGYECVGSYSCFDAGGGQVRTLVVGRRNGARAGRLGAAGRRFRGHRRRPPGAAGGQGGGRAAAIARRLTRRTITGLSVSGTSPSSGLAIAAAKARTPITTDVQPRAVVRGPAHLRLHQRPAQRVALDPDVGEAGKRQPGRIAAGPDPGTCILADQRRRKRHEGDDQQEQQVAPDERVVAARQLPEHPVMADPELPDDEEADEEADILREQAEQRLRQRRLGDRGRRAAAGRRRRAGSSRWRTPRR